MEVIILANYANLSKECLLAKKSSYLKEISEYETAILPSNSQIYLLYLASMIGNRKNKVRLIDAELALRKIEAEK